jgi:hypothetical protein
MYIYSLHDKYPMTVTVTVIMSPHMSACECVISTITILHASVWFLHTYRGYTHAHIRNSTQS